jgi:hypothetical protein
MGKVITLVAGHLTDRNLIDTPNSAHIQCDAVHTHELAWLCFGPEVVRDPLVRRAVLACVLAAARFAVSTERPPQRLPLRITP